MFLNNNDFDTGLMKKRASQQLLLLT